ncbi:hypothetical protein KH5_01620 [Urechidicola sp. KH5]
MLQPVMPLIEYNLNKEYIVSVLCENRNKPELGCNGKCYIAKEISNSHNHQEHEIPAIDLSKYPISIVELNNDSNNSFSLFFKHRYYYTLKNTQDYQEVILKPPTV